MRDLLVLVPTRDRPDNITRLCAALAETCTGDTQTMVLIDEDNWRPYVRPLVHQNVWASMRPRLKVPAKLNGAALRHLDEFRAIGFIGDDAIPRTVGWDAAIMSALDELGTGIVYPNDLMHGDRHGVHVFMTTDIIRALGYMCPEFDHCYIDNVWMDWGHAIDRLRYLPDVIVEHLQPNVRKAPRDGIYAEGDAYMAADQERYRAYLADGIPGDVAKLAALLV